MKLVFVLCRSFSGVGCGGGRLWHTEIPYDLKSAENKITNKVISSIFTWFPFPVLKNFETVAVIIMTSQSPHTYFLL